MTTVLLCPVCDADSPSPFLTRNNVPVQQNLTIADQQRAMAVPRGDLHLIVCNQCGFVFNGAFELEKLSYDEGYDNSQTFSPSFEAYQSELVRYLVVDKGVVNSQVVEVGCGKGLFLRKLAEYGGANNTGYGFDPTYVGPLQDLDGRLNFRKSFYGPDCADIPADVVVCRHVIEHVPDPVALLRTVRQALVHSSHARVFFETPCVDWILRNQVIWDFFYEHCSLFTPASLTTAFEQAGFHVESVSHVFGGQYLWLEATLAAGECVVHTNAGNTPDLARQFSFAERERIETWRTKIRQLADGGRVALWGAGAKGVTLANLIDPERHLIAAIVDLNPAKQGCYVPGTGHQIISYQKLAEWYITTAILMNPNYREENLRLLRESNLDVSLVEKEEE